MVNNCSLPDPIKLRLKARLGVHEGRIPHLYLDSLGLVTCAVGHLLSSADAMAAIPMVLPNGEEASLEQKKVEWKLVKSLEPNKLPSYYAQRTTLRMTDRVMNSLQDSDLESFHAGLRHELADFDQLPIPVQEALLDMTFQLGAGGLVRKFPKLIAAVKARDWAACAADCHRAGIQEWRNNATAVLFKQAV